jgi:hypothetical protein
MVSAQGHWGIEPGDAGPPRGHVHTELDLALLDQPVSGTITIPVRFVGFHNPGVIREIDVRGRPDSDGSDFNIPTPEDFPKPALWFGEGEVVHDYSVTVDTRRFPFDGWQQLRIAPIVKFPDGSGHEMRSILRVAVNVQNGKLERDWIDPRTGVRVRGLEGVGFYVPTGYARVGLRSDLPDLVGNSLTLNVDFSADSCDRCSEQRQAITRSAIRFDPDLHHGVPGTTVWGRDGSFRGNVTLDTSGLAPGPHKLLLRIKQWDPRLRSTNVGHLVVPFTKVAALAANAEVAR